MHRHAKHRSPWRNPNVANLQRALLATAVTTYSVAWLLRVDEAERLALSHLVRANRNTGRGNELHQTLKLMRDALSVPFRDSHYLSAFSEGMIYGCYLYVFYPEKAKEMQHKLFWERFFSENDILHATSVVTCEQGKRTSNKEIVSNDQYIVKPSAGSWGNGISSLFGRDVDRHPCNGGDEWVLQPRLVDCRADTVRHFRLVTLADGTRFSLWELRGKKGSVASNHGQGGAVRFCDSGYCRHLADDESRALEKISEQLLQAHATKLSFVFSIGTAMARQTWRPTHSRGTFAMERTGSIQTTTKRKT